MKRLLLRSSSFVRAAKKRTEKAPQLSADIQSALGLLATDAFQPKLKTHILKGDLDGSWACTAGYDLRIIFRFVSHEGNEAILLESIGAHDEVY